MLQVWHNFRMIHVIPYQNSVTFYDWEKFLLSEVNGDHLYAYIWSFVLFLETAFNCNMISHQPFPLEAIGIIDSVEDQGWWKEKELKFTGCKKVNKQTNEGVLSLEVLITHWFLNTAFQEMILTLKYIKRFECLLFSLYINK